MPIFTRFIKRFWLQQSAKRAVFLLCFLAPVLGMPALAEEKAQKPDIRLVIDVSGSMKKNDPSNLRQPAIDLLVRLLPEGSKAGVWTFGKYVNMLIPHRVVDDRWREMAREKAKEINSVGLFTNIGGALEKAAHDLKRPSADHHTSVILLTDGMVDISKSPEENQKEWRRIVDKVLPDIKNADFTIHSVALSENADENLLERLAVETDGISAVARNADELMKIFLKAFDVAAPAQQVPLEGNTFIVDSSVEEFTALIFRLDPQENTQIQSPDESVYDVNSMDSDVNWLRTEKYDLITVKRPVEGEWVLNAKVDPDSRVTIVSDMILKVKSLPNNGFRGLIENLQFALQEDGKTITRADFLSLLESTVNMAYGPENTATKRVWSHSFDRSKVPSNGIFKVALPELAQMGVYDIEIEVDGKTFKRRFNHKINVREPFTTTIEQTVGESGSEQYVLTVKAHGDNLDYKKTQVAATILNPKRRKVIKPLAFTEFDHWQTVINPTAKGSYKINVLVNGVDEDGQPFDYELSTVIFDFQPDSAFEEPAETAVDVEPIKQADSPPETDKVKSTDSETPPAEPTQPIEVVAPEAINEAVNIDKNEGTPPWLMYAVLGVGNLIILGGGFFLYKKLSSSGEEEELLEDDGPEPPLEPLEAGIPEPEVSSEDSAEDEMNMSGVDMDDGDSDADELPPMEDLEPDDPPKLDDPIDESIEFPEDIKEPPPVVDGMSEEEEDLKEEDFGIDDIEDDFDEQPIVGSSGIDDMEEEMKKTQGLDLSDDELDGALNELIDDLGDDGFPEESKESGSRGDDDEFDPEDLSDIDFDEDDNK